MKGILNIKGFFQLIRSPNLIFIALTQSLFYYRIIVPSFIVNGQPRQLLKETDFFLHPSLTTSDGRIEGLPNAIMEALAVGVPVIATKHSGIEELMCPDGALFLVEEWNVAEYAETMVQLIEGKLSYDLKKSRRMIEERFSSKQHIAQLLDFYEEELIGSISQTRMS